MKILDLTVCSCENGMLLRDFLRTRCAFTTSLIKRAKRGGLFVNGKSVTVRCTLCEKDTVRILLPEEASGSIEPLSLPLTVLTEDAELLIVYKPTGMPTHPSRGNRMPTLANVVAAYLSPSPPAFHAITRLDRDTEGIVLLAKNTLCASRLGEAMKRGEIEKCYLAVTARAPIPAAGRIDAPIRREAEGSLRRTVSPDGKRAITLYRTLAVSAQGHALLLVRPLTGRTHQIRVHLSSIGAPLHGDPLYGEERAGRTYRLAAVALSLTHPTTGEPMAIRCLPAFVREEFPEVTREDIFSAFPS